MLAQPIINYIAVAVFFATLLERSGTARSRCRANVGAANCRRRWSAGLSTSLYVSAVTVATIG
jgi:hypothetical protein